jgi:virginiamycin A acetyltransferase
MPGCPETQRGGWDREHPRIVAAAYGVARGIVTPLVISHRLGLIGFHSGGQLLSLVPGAAGLLVRRAWYSATLLRCGARLRVQFGAVFRNPATCVGDDCIFGEYNCIGLADIGSHFMSADHVSVLSGPHGHRFDRRDLPISRQPTAARRIVVGADVWAGAGARLAADVAAHSIIGAGAVVVEAFQEWSILGGVPARVIGDRPAHTGPDRMIASSE